MTKPDNIVVLHKEDYEVRTIPRSVASDMVSRYHYARGGSNTGVFFHGLFLRESDECKGVAWWLPPTKSAAQSVCPNWQSVLSLTRLVIHPDIPQNGASYLLARSMKLVFLDSRWDHLVTWADTRMGHTGNIYRATNWTYDGETRGSAVYLDQAGRQVANKAGGAGRTRSEMLGLGYTFWGYSKKHRFVYHRHGKEV